MGRPLRPWPVNALAGYELAMVWLAEVEHLHVQASEALVAGETVRAMHLLHTATQRLTRATRALERAREGRRINED